MPGSYLPPLTSALAVALLGPAHRQTPSAFGASGSWWPKNSTDERRFLYSYPRECRTLTAASEQIEKIRVGHPDSEPLTAYHALREFAATLTPAQLDQQGRPTTNVRSVQQLLRHTETFLRKNKVSEKEIDTIVQAPNTLKVPPATLTKIFYPAEAGL